jgi:hypothetical protein
MKIIRLFLVITIFFISPIVSADALRGVKEITIIVEDLDSEASMCNISKDMLDTSIRLPLSNSKIRVVKLEDNPQSFLYVHVIAIDSGSMCRLYVELSFRKFVIAEKRYGQFWRKNVLLSNSKLSSSKATGEILEDFTKQFIGAWLKANLN